MSLLSHRFVALAALSTSILAASSAMAQDAPTSPVTPPASSPPPVAAAPAPIAPAPNPVEPVAAPPSQARGMTLSLSLERVVGVAYSSARPSDASSSVSVTTVGVGGPSLNPVSIPRIGFDVILPSNLTLGAAVGFGLISIATHPDNGDGQTAESGKAYILSPRVGYRIEVAPWLDITPRAGVTLLGGSLTGPQRNVCSSAPPYDCTQKVDGTTDSLFAAAASVEVVGAMRVTKSFNILAGVAYDHVFAASGSEDRPTSATDRQTSDEKVDGKYLGVQLWGGLGGYF